MNNVSMRLPKQFLLAQMPFTELPDWRHIEYLGWWLSLAPEVPLIKIQDCNGSTIGLIIGWCIWRGRLLQEGDTIRSLEQTEGIAKEYEEWGGRFVYFLEHKKQLAAITDAAGMMSLVYSEEKRILASTPAVMQRFGTLEHDEKMCRAFSGGKPEKWFPFGITPYRGVRRLLPNHRLTLQDWRNERFFPRPDGEGLRGDPQVDIDSVARSIAQWVRENIKALVEAGHNVAHLTGGFDSRMVLAASRDYVPDMRFQTVSMPDKRVRLDCHIAAGIARKFDLDYRALQFLPPSEPEVSEWLQRTGHCIEDTVAAFCTTARVYNSHCHEITGTCGEAMRVPYWYSGDDQRQSLNAREFMHRFEIVENEITRKLTDEWLAALPPGTSVGNALDIAYVEQRVACWAGPSMFGHDIALPSISPFSSARYYRAILSIPESLRARNLLAPAFVNHLWPELLKIPVNRAGGLAKLRFLSQEIRLILPVEARDHIKRFLQLFQNTGHGSLKKFRS